MQSSSTRHLCSTRQRELNSTRVVASTSEPHFPYRHLPPTSRARHRHAASATFGFSPLPIAAHGSCFELYPLVLNVPSLQARLKCHSASILVSFKHYASTPTNSSLSTGHTIADNPKAPTPSDIIHLSIACEICSFVNGRTSAKTAAVNPTHAAV